MPGIRGLRRGVRKSQPLLSPVNRNLPRLYGAPRLRGKAGTENIRTGFRPCFRFAEKSAILSVISCGCVAWPVATDAAETDDDGFFVHGIGSRVVDIQRMGGCGRVNCGYGE
jgi:hypothetical protein